MYRLTIPSIDDQEIQGIKKVLKSGFLVQGKNVAEFERISAKYLGVRYAVAVNSGTSALHLALLALGIGSGDEVIIPDYTFPATANVVELVGAKPVIVDIDPATFNIDPLKIEPAISKKTKAIMPVHLFGQSADLNPILKLVKKYKLKMIEDAACVLGATYGGRKCGTFGDVGCFSYHPRKIITTAEGGLLVTGNKSIADRVKVLRNHGIQYRNNKIDFILPGFNYRMTELQAVMGIVQMRKISKLISVRPKIALEYANQLRGIPWLEIPPKPALNHHVYQTYIVLLSQDVSRDKLIQYMKENGVETNIGTYALHQQSYYRKKYNLKSKDYPVCQEICSRAFALPVYNGLTKGQIIKISNIIRRFE